MEYLTALQSIRRLHPKVAYAGDPKRFIYWGNVLTQGVGVSYIDPMFATESEETQHCEILKLLLEDKVDVLSISDGSEDPVGQELSAEVMRPFENLTVVKRTLTDDKGNDVGKVCHCWVEKHVEHVQIDEDDLPWDVYADDNVLTDYYKNVVTDYAYNDHTNRAFNYFYIKKLLTNTELAEKVLRYDYFTDAKRVARRYGYESPAYALALYKSLYQSGVLERALKSYADFLHFHPYDQITLLCESTANVRFAHALMENAVNPIKEIEQEDVTPRRDYRDDDDYGPVYYVDDCPVYGCCSQEEAEIEYWNTH